MAAFSMKRIRYRTILFECSYTLNLGQRAESREQTNVQGTPTRISDEKLMGKFVKTFPWRISTIFLLSSYWSLVVKRTKNRKMFRWTNAITRTEWTNGKNPNSHAIIRKMFYVHTWKRPLVEAQCVAMVFFFSSSHFHVPSLSHSFFILQVTTHSRIVASRMNELNNNDK